MPVGNDFKVTLFLIASYHCSHRVIAFSVFMPAMSYNHCWWWSFVFLFDLLHSSPFLPGSVMDQMDLSCNSVYSELALITLPFACRWRQHQRVSRGGSAAYSWVRAGNPGIQLTPSWYYDRNYALSYYSLAKDWYLNDCSVIYLQVCYLDS